MNKLKRGRVALAILCAVSFLLCGGLAMAAEKLIKLKGVMIGSDGVRVAMVNNQMVREGELIQVEHKKRIYRWRAGAIRENKVSWEKAEVISP